MEQKGNGQGHLGRTWDAIRWRFRESPAPLRFLPVGMLTRRVSGVHRVSFTRLTKEGSDLAGLVAVNFGTARI